MSERLKPSQEWDRRFDALPQCAQLYLSLGQSISREGLIPEIKEELKTGQLTLLTQMTPIEKAQLIEFIGWRDKSVGEING